MLYDDRAAGPGEKFADAELVGVPLRLTVGRRTLEAGELEAQLRRGREQRSVPLDSAAKIVGEAGRETDSIRRAAAAVAELWQSLP